MRVIGITGGIGAGKTYVSELIRQHYGLPTYNCDTEAKRLTIESADIRSKLTALLGDDVYSPNGQLNKTLLAKYLFATKDNADRINAIIHPAVRRDFLRWKEENRTSTQQGGEADTTLLLESAILLESHFDQLCDEIILVTAPLDLRIQRATERDDTTPEAIRQRIQAQLSDEERLRLAGTQKPVHIIINDGRELSEQIKQII